MKSTWVKVKIRDICEIKYGKALKKSNRIEGEFPVYGSNGIVGYHNKPHVQNKTLIIGRKGSIGEIHYSSTPCWPIDTTYFIDLDNTKVHLKWFFYLLKKLNLQRLNRSAAIPGLNRDDVYRINIQLPPLDDQLRIATLLSRVEELITKRKESIRLLDELLKSTFLEMFGNSHISKEKWGVENLGNYITFLTSGSRGWAKYYSDTGKIFLRIQNVENARLKLDDVIRVLPPDSAETKRTKVREGDLLLSITADLGRTAVVPKGFEEAHINQHLALIRLKTQLDPVFTAFFYSTPFGQSIIRKYDRVGVKSGLNFNDIKKMKIIVPPKKLQIKFTEIFYKVESLKNKYETSLQELENLYGSLSQRAFRGELDVSKVPIHHEAQFHTSYARADVSPKVSWKRTQLYEFEFKTLIHLINNKLPAEFTFDELQNLLAEINFDSKPEYQILKKVLLECLEGKSSFLRQTFGYPVSTNNDREKQDKQIFFSVNQ